MQKKSFPRILIAAPQSGSGKTYLTCGLLRLLSGNGRRLHAFKCGPDFIDPLFHKQVLGIPSGNLDSFFTGEEQTLALFAKEAEGYDLSVMEGVMGYYDGLGGRALTASSYDLARITKTPVILVINARGMSRTVVPLIKGLLSYTEESWIRGVIFNRVSSSAYRILTKCMEEIPGVNALGYLPELKDASWGSRHLGLIQPEEIPLFQNQIDALANQLKETLDLEALLSLAQSAPPLPLPAKSSSSYAKPSPSPSKVTALRGESTQLSPDQREEPALPFFLQKKVPISIARDASFSFFYEENLRLLMEYGAKPVFFSPMKDAHLPKASGLILPGGYPELHLQELSKNTSLLHEIRAAIESGMPTLAECGGFLYLQKSVQDTGGQSFPLVNLLPGSAHKNSRLVRFGYLELTAKAGQNLPYLSSGEKIRGHEFHYYDTDANGESCTAEKPVGGRSWDCMVSYKNLLAGFPHLYYESNPDLIRRFVEKCRGLDG